MNSRAVNTHVRGMATLKEIRLRLKSVTNIQKITKSMKMVSASKYARAERELRPAKAYGVGAQVFYDKAEVKPSGDDNSKRLIVAMTSDRGLCGGVHSSICKTIRGEIQKQGPGIETKLVLIGDKAKAQLFGLFSNKFLASYNNIGKKPPSFLDASFLASRITDLGYHFDIGSLYYNVFRTVVSYKTTVLPLFNEETVKTAKKVALYDSVDDEVLTCFNEFMLTSLIYYALKESACSEQSSRMTAMEAASKNAGEMIDKLTMTFNRTRQAVITRELIEIISGAAAL